MIELIMRSAGDGRFEVKLGAKVLGRTRQPLLDGARWLIGLGYPEDELLTVRAAGCAYPSFRPDKIGALAKLRVEERDSGGLILRPWRPLDPAAFAARTAENEVSG